MLDIKHPWTGHYLYNNKAYIRRTDALDDMLLNHDYNSKIQFWFNDDVFGNIDWTVPVPASLDSLYRFRAQQIRDKYKYVVLAFSGGSDSVQILNTFLKNKIFIDEIIVVHHSSLADKIDRNDMLKDATLGTFLEYRMAVVPLLDRVKKESPKTKITTLDVSAYLCDQLIHKKFGHMGGDHKLSHNNSRVYPIFPRSYMHAMVLNMKNRDTNGMCLIRGVDKPVLKITQNKLFFQFNDIPMHGSRHINENEIDKVFIFEDFFWSRDMPLIPVKQTQVLKEVLEKSRNFYNIFCGYMTDIDQYYKKNLDGQSSGGQLERFYSMYIYPDHPRNLFAAPKPKSKAPEFELVKRVVGYHHGETFLDEQKQSALKKYNKIIDKSQLNKFLYSRHYNAGALYVKWSD